MRKWIVMPLLIFSHSLLAISAINDFAYRAEIKAAQRQLQRVELSIDVLLNLTQSNLTDLAIFDNDGKALPHSVQKALLQTIRKQTELKFHVFDSFQQQRSKIVTTREKIQQDGQTSELETTETVDTHQLRRDYLIELPKSPAVEELELSWIQEPANQLLQIKVGVGTELDNLRSIDNNKVISNVNPAAPDWRFIKHIPKGQKYLRISPADNITRFELQSVVGHYLEKQAGRQLWHAVETSTVNIENESYITFDSPSAVAASALRIIPTEAHSMINATLYASNNDFKHKKRIHTNFSQHNIVGSGIKPSKPVPLPNRDYRRWWVSLESPSTPVPRIELAYPVHEVIFLSNEKSPFTLAWGNFQHQPSNGDLADLISLDLSIDENRGSKVSMRATQLAGGVFRLAPEPALPWKKWLLWALLVSAALITGRMAYRLYQDMNQH